MEGTSEQIKNMNGGDDKKHLDTLGVLLVVFFKCFLGDMEDRWREHLNRGNGGFPMVFRCFQLVEPVPAAVPVKRGRLVARDGSYSQ